MKTKHNFMKKLMLFSAAFAFCFAVFAKPIDVDAALTAPTASQYAASTTAVGIEWNEISGATKYGIQYATTQAGLNNATEYASKYNYGAIKGLTAGTTYYVRVRAYTSTEVSAWSNIVETYTAPNNITSIKQTSAKETSVTFAWSPVAGATGYKIYSCLPNGSYNVEKPDAIVASSVTSYTKSVPKNSVYYVTVIPTRNGYDFPADNSSIKETYCVSLPTKPSNLNIVGGDPDKKILEFFWKPTSIAANTAGYEVEVYQLKKTGKTKRIYRKTISSSEYNSYILNNSGYPIKKSSMFNNAIRFRVRAYVTVDGKKAYGAWSSYKNYVPQAPQTKLKYQSYTSATLTWKKVNGAASYDIYYKSSKYGSWKRIAKGVKGNSYHVKANYFGESRYYVKANKVKFGKKKLNSSSPKKAPYAIVWVKEK